MFSFGIMEGKGGDVRSPLVRVYVCHVPSHSGPEIIFSRCKSVRSLFPNRVVGHLGWGPTRYCQTKPFLRL